MSGLAIIGIVGGSFISYVFVAGLVWQLYGQHHDEGEDARGVLATALWPAALPAWLLCKALVFSAVTAPRWLITRPGRSNLPRAEVRK